MSFPADDACHPFSCRTLSGLRAREDASRLCSRSSCGRAGTGRRSGNDQGFDRTAEPLGGLAGLLHPQPVLGSAKKRRPGKVTVSKRESEGDLVSKTGSWHEKLWRRQGRITGMYWECYSFLMFLVRSMLPCSLTMRNLGWIDRFRCFHPAASRARTRIVDHCIQ